MRPFQTVLECLKENVQPCGAKFGHPQYQRYVHHPPSSFVSVNNSYAQSEISFAVPSTSSSTLLFSSFSYWTCLKNHQLDHCYHHQLVYCHLCYCLLDRMHGCFTMYSGSSLVTCHLWQNRWAKLLSFSSSPFWLIVWQLPCGIFGIEHFHWCIHIYG